MLCDARSMRWTIAVLIPAPRLKSCEKLRKSTLNSGGPIGLRMPVKASKMDACHKTAEL